MNSMKPEWISSGLRSLHIKFQLIFWFNYYLFYYYTRITYSTLSLERRLKKNVFNIDYLY